MIDSSRTERMSMFAITGGDGYRGNGASQNGFQVRKTQVDLRFQFLDFSEKRLYTALSECRFGVSLMAVPLRSLLPSRLFPKMLFTEHSATKTTMVE